MTDLRDYERRTRRPLDDEDEDERYLEEEENGKAPVVFRVAAWVSLVVLLFAAGYWGTSMILKYLDKKQIIVQEQVVSDTDGARDVLRDNSASGLPGRKSGFDIFIPRGEVLVSSPVTHVSGLMEDDVKAVIMNLLETMKAENTISEQVRVLHVFRNGDLLYLDLNDRFLSALENMSSGKAALVMTSIVRSVVHNFPPVVKVRFLINGKDPELKKPVDLTKPWQLKTS
ncbi:MAG TPA: GerMN domain-containing protein [Synergistales bacterium]|nr:GerMN domain-containing protein [Synergistales bacterium]HRV71596.1 GerMN domain-containing protein [Thermovirgaceae bacterium]